MQAGAGIRSTRVGPADICHAGVPWAERVGQSARGTTERHSLPKLTGMTILSPPDPAGIAFLCPRHIDPTLLSPNPARRFSALFHPVLLQPQQFRWAIISNPFFSGAENHDSSGSPSNPP